MQSISNRPWKFHNIYMIRKQVTQILENLGRLVERDCIWLGMDLEIQAWKLEEMVKSDIVPLPKELDCIYIPVWYANAHLIIGKRGSSYQMSHSAQVLGEGPQKFLLGRLINTNKNSRCTVKNNCESFHILHIFSIYFSGNVSACM